ncbi:MAG: hypothetical protein AAF790_12945, partial [Planctomycetota bacterium]
MVVELELSGSLLAKDYSGAGAPLQSDRAGDAKGDAAERMPLTVTATLGYDERQLSPARAVRHYTRAEANIKSGAGIRAPRLAAGKRRIVADRQPGGRALLSCDGPPLSREELDLIDIVGDARALDMLLPDGSAGGLIEPGGQWPVSGEAMAALLGLDSVAVCDVACTLDRGNTKFVRFTLAGTVQGVVDSAATEYDVRAIGLFSRRQRTVTQLNLAMNETRAIGPATPGLEGSAKAKISRKPIATPPALQGIAGLAPKPTPAGPRRPLLLDADRQGFRVVHDRQWFIAGQTHESVTLRRIDATGLTAQTTLKRMPAKAESQLPTLDR